jgi:hypothetical protein
MPTTAEMIWGEIAIVSVGGCSCVLGAGLLEDNSQQDAFGVGASNCISAVVWAIAIMEQPGGQYMPDLECSGQ